MKQPGGWKGQRGTRHQRGYGRQWEKLREAILQRDTHLCQPCQREGRVTASNAVDHIKPKSKGGGDDPENLQSICNACHDLKSAEEAKEAQRALRQEGKARTGEDGWPIQPKRWGWSIPDGVRHSAIPVTVVTGPPASGKSTWVADRARKADTVIDLDAIKERVGGVKWDDDAGVVKRSLAYRDMIIRALADRIGGQAWLIVTAPSRAERAAWLEALGPKATLVTMDTPKDVCRERIQADPDREASARAMMDVLKRWEA